MEFKRDYLGIAIFLLISLAFAVWWIRMRLGLDKRWFVMPSRALISRNLYFALPTLILGVVVGLIAVLLVAIDPNNNNALIFLVLAFGLWILGFIFAYLEPNWMSPDWYRWLKREHGDILPYLAEEAHQLGREEWLKRVETQEDLEQWVEEFRRNHGL